MKIVTVEQMQRLEEASASEGVSTDTLMENAGLAVAKVASRELGSAAGRRILVLVGPGNNGGDGLVAARHLQRWGAEVTAWVLVPRRDDDHKLKLALEFGVHLLSAKDDSADAILARSDLVIDAVLGTGSARPLEGAIKQAMIQLDSIREASRERGNTKVLALDLPTGLNADTGETDPACPDVDVTIALGYPKTGHLRFPGAAKLGRLEVADIGIPQHLAEDIKLEVLTSDWVQGKLPQRALSAHKGTFGHVLVIAGSRNYVGAASLAAQAAARVGPGLVTLASPESIYPFLASKLTEIIHMPLPDDRKEGNVTIHPDAAGVIKKSIRHYDSMVVGCGLGNSEGLIEFMRKLLMAGPQPEIPVLIDADGLNNMSAIKDWWQRLKSPVVVTPHPGEMSKLTGVPTSSIERSRWETATEWAAKWGHVVVLKGAHTVVASPDGACRVSPFANPALASGGTGDVLAGITGGLLAQGLSPEDAAGCAVYIHGAAGELVRDEIGDTGAVAGDLIPALPRTIKAIREV